MGMGRRFCLLSLIVLLVVFGLFSAVSAEIAVGVKSGDWIEYRVTYTGSPTKGHDVVWARMEIVDVQEATILVKITSMFPDGTIEELNATLNLKTGQLIDDFIIPANLNAGDTFFDQNLGNVTIDRAEERLYAGDLRTVLFACVGQNMYVWDQATGVSVEGTSLTPQYSIHTIVDRTNLWQPSSGGAENSFVVYLVAAAVLVATAAVVVAVWYRRKNRLIK